MKRFLFLFALIASFQLQSAAQYIIKGQVFEQDGKTTIPFVNILALPSNEGTVTDIDGFFSLKTDKKVSSLTLSYIGYETLKYKVEAYTSDTLKLTLFTSDIKINETIILGNRRVIKKDTAAITLYRNVVKHKEENRPKNLEAYYYKEHSKIQFDLYNYNEKLPTRFYMKPFKFAFDFADSTASGIRTLPALLQEDLIEVYYNKNPELNKKRVLATQATGLENVSATLILSDYLIRIDMYENVIEAGGKPFSSPFSPSGITTYNYFLSDSIVNSEGTTVYRLDFSPKNKHSIAFNGYAWIEKSNFAITEMEFRVPTKANLNFINDFYVNQKFEKPDNKNWFLTEEEMHVAFNPLKNKKGRSLLLQKRIKRDDITINAVYEDSIFKGPEVVYEDSVDSRSKLWWAENRLAPLTEAETNIGLVVDSILRMRVYHDLQRLIYFASTGYIRVGRKVPVEIGQAYKFISWNNVEGLRPKFGFRTNKFLSKDFQLTSYLAYGLKDKQWKGLASLRVMLPTKNQRWNALELSYVNDFTFLGATNSEQKFNHDNLFLSLLRTAPLQKIMRIEEFRAQWEKEWVNGFTTELIGSRRTFFAIPNTFEFDRLDKYGNIVSFPSFSTTEIGIISRFEFGKNYFKNDYYRMSAGSRKPIVSVEYTLGLKGALGGSYGYHKFELKYQHRWAHILGFTKYKIQGGYILGEAAYPLLFMHQGNNNFYYSSSAYSNMGEFEYASNRYASLWIDHHFDGKILNNIPLIKLLKFRSIFLFKILVGDIQASNRDIILMPNSLTHTFAEKEKVYMEMGFGIENILKVMRVDFMWRLTQRDKQFDGRGVQKFAIKFAFQPKF